LIVLSPAAFSSGERLSNQAYDAALCPAYIWVLHADIDHLVSIKQGSNREQGLRQRISSATLLSSWLCRRYVAEYADERFELAEYFSSLKSAIFYHQWRKAKQLLDSLKSHIPLNTHNKRSKDATTKDVSVARDVYELYCQSCHHMSNVDVKLPAYSFSQMVRTMSEEEWIARMMLGVHGTPAIGLRNPLTDRDIAGMRKFFLNQAD
jgi:hypothetical protein